MDLEIATLAEIDRLRALNAELLAALQRIAQLECGTLDPRAGLQMFTMAGDIARSALKGEK